MGMATSFRDPAGHLLQVNGRILRIINRSGVADFRAFRDSYSAKQLIDSGSLVNATVLDERPSHFQGPGSAYLAQNEGTVVEHERIRFQSFPYEWPGEMVHAAAHLTLDMAEGLLSEGFGLKDATPYNVLFQGPQPVFVDWLSFERRDPCDPTWLPYAQFLRTFLLPLLVNKHFGLRFDHLLLASRDGLEPEEVYKLSGPIRKLRPPFLTLVSLPVWLAAKGDANGKGTYAPRRTESSEQARFILGHLFKGLRRKLKAVAPKQGKTSAWSDYTLKNRYTEDYIPLKESFVEAALQDGGCSCVLDVGCNTGFFSELAARRGASVVAIDHDPIVVGELWRHARAESLDILPLVVNLARPTPSTGWLNNECPSFLDRARGSFDAVLMLAVIHHMLVTERIPLPQIIRLASEMTTKLLIIEYVPPDDPMFRRITRGREHLHQDLTRETFESACRQHFEIVRVAQLGDSGRWIYQLRTRPEVR